MATEETRVGAHTMEADTTEVKVARNRADTVVAVVRIRMTSAEVNRAAMEVGARTRIALAVAVKSRADTAVAVKNKVGTVEEARIRAALR